MRSLALPEKALSRKRFGLDDRIAEFLPKIAIAEVDPSNSRLEFKFLGADLLEYFDENPLGTDYLRMVADSTKARAMESALSIVNRPCGLWQLTPGLDATGDIAFLEYTIFPILQDDTGRNLLAVFVYRSPMWPKVKLRLAEIEPARVWNWIDIGFGAPEHPASRERHPRLFDELRAQMEESGLLGAANLSDAQIAKSLGISLGVTPPDNDEDDD